LAILNKKNNFSYHAYGLGIQSTIPLSELIPEEAGCDLFVNMGNGAPEPPGANGKQWHFDVTPEEANLFFKDVGIFQIYGGREIIVNSALDIKDRVLQFYIVGPAMAVLLYQRDLLVLHASSVEMAGGAVAFMGERGYGKSSTAAALISRGHNLVNDDVTPVEVDIGPVSVSPGFPLLKLSEEVAASLGYDADCLFQLQHNGAKFGYRVLDGFAQKALPLKHIFLLAEGAFPEIETLRPQEAFLELVRNSYPIRMSQPAGASHFLKCANLATRVPISRLKNPYSLSSLPDLACLVEEHVFLESESNTKAYSGIVESQSVQIS
jgi:hypothetical protein